jgi:hypothetical protein
MTTTVRILVEGNKAVKVTVTDTPRADGSVDFKQFEVLPNHVGLAFIHGDMKIEVQETGEFLK